MTSRSSGTQPSRSWEHYMLSGGSEVRPPADACGTRIANGRFTKAADLFPAVCCATI